LELLVTEGLRTLDLVNTLLLRQVLLIQLPSRTQLLTLVRQLILLQGA
jgi:hypothetical protein